MRCFIFILACVCIIVQAQLIERAPQGEVVPSNQPAPSSTASGPSASAQPNPPQASGGTNTSGTRMQTAVPNPTAPIISGSNDNNSLNALPTSASFGNSIYAASATFLTPTSSKSVAPLYRIDNRENITFVWEFTNMRVRPEMLTLAAVGPNKITYTIATLAGVATSAVWQVKDVPSASPLMMGFYQIQLYDQRGPDAPYQPGWLSPVSRLNIAFYQPETYQPGSGPDYCPLCFYSASKRFSESLGSFGIAVGVALLTSVLIVCGLMY